MSVLLASPGDDLNALASTTDWLMLEPGIYYLDAPLTINSPVVIDGIGAVTLVFTQPVGQSWAAAIKILSSRVTLCNFAVRFGGPINWIQGIPFGPAVIGMRDTTDPWSATAIEEITFRRLDLMTPPPTNNGDEAISIIRGVGGNYGIVDKCSLYGGVVVWEKTWRITNNYHLGVPSGSVSYGAFAAQGTLNSVVSNNVVVPGQGGKNWRFMVLSNQGKGDLVEGNRVLGIGRSPTDQDVNANEIFLTESYRVHYEGPITSLSADGLTLTAGPQPGWTDDQSVAAGDIVAVLNGAQAGQWVEIVGVVEPNVYLLSSPLYDVVTVSIATGFIDQTYCNNYIDARGTLSFPIVLAGNHFGTKLQNNILLGGSMPCRLTACPSEEPISRGWTRSPMFGLEVTGNQIVDCDGNAEILVETEGLPPLHQNCVYMSIMMNSNTQSSQWIPTSSSAMIVT